MKIQYQIMELDTEHLKKFEGSVSGKRDRICFIPADLKSWASNKYDSKKEAYKAIEKHGNDYTEYTIIPRIFMTD